MIFSYLHGGSNGADNILWKVGADNLRREARNRTATGTAILMAVAYTLALYRGDITVEKFRDHSARRRSAAASRPASGS